MRVKLLENLFAALNAVLSFVTPVSDFFWDFPKMFGFWKDIPVLGSFSWPSSYWWDQAFISHFASDSYRSASS